ncbi:MAG: hypothetical protein Q8Q18_02700 [bacterium]|nr:hypothetical protein [bacterium]
MNEGMPKQTEHVQEIAPLETAGVEIFEEVAELDNTQLNNIFEKVKNERKEISSLMGDGPLTLEQRERAYQLAEYFVKIKRELDSRGAFSKKPATTDEQTVHSPEKEARIQELERLIEDTEHVQEIAPLETAGVEILDEVAELDNTQLNNIFELAKKEEREISSLILDVGLTPEQRKRLSLLETYLLKIRRELASRGAFSKKPATTDEQTVHSPEKEARIQELERLIEGAEQNIKGHKEWIGTDGWNRKIDQEKLRKFESELRKYNDELEVLIKPTK